jgi:plastocyanin
MKTKLIVLLLILSAVLLSGCLGNEQPSPEKNATPGETATPVETTPVETTPVETTPVETTPVETMTSEGDQTPAETISPAENATPEGNVTPGTGEVITSGVRDAPYVIRLANYRASASSLEIKKGEMVAWLNLQENPKRNFTLVSEEGLFENATLVYKHSFVHTFNETGNYNFVVIGQPRMNVSVSVAAS